MSRQQAAYAFEDLPLADVDAGTTLLVTGSGRATTALATDLVLAGDDHDEGMVFVSTERSGRRLIRDCTARRPDLGTTRLGVIDASGSGDVETSTDAITGSVSSSSDLTGISIEFSCVYSALYKRDTRRIRSCFDSISILLLYTDFRTMTRFVHTMIGRVRKTDGLGVFVLDPSMHEPQVTQTLARLCDGRVEVRDEGTPELRVEGLSGQPADWTAFES